MNEHNGLLLLTLWLCFTLLFQYASTVPPPVIPLDGFEQIHISIRDLEELSEIDRCVKTNITALKSQCQLGYDRIYVGPNNTINTLDAYASQVAMFGTVVAGECRDSASPFACGNLFRECISLDFQHNSTTYTIRPWQPVCRSLCHAIVDNCPPFILKAASSAFPFLQPSCVIPYSLPWPGFDDSITMFPEIGWNFILLDEDDKTVLQNHFVHCKKNLTESFSPDVPVRCMAPFAKVLDPGDGPVCELPCPDPSYSEEEYKNVKIVLGITGWASFILTLFIAVSYFIDKTRRTFPRNLPMMVFISSNIISLGVIIPTMASYDTVWCNDQPTGLHHASGACVLQGIFLMYGALSACFWWLSITIHLYISITHRAQFELQPKYFYIACFGIPVPLVIIALAAKKISYFNSSTICFVNVDDNSMWQYGLFYIPIMITLLIGVPLMFIIMYKVWQVARESNTFPASTQIRIGIFLIIYTYIWFFFIIYRFVATKKKDQIEAAFQSWVICKVKQPFGECELSDRMDYGLWIIYALNAGIQGLMIALPFGTDEAVYQPWKSLKSQISLSSSKSVAPTNPTVL